MKIPVKSMLTTTLDIIGDGVETLQVVDDVNGEPHRYNINKDNVVSEQCGYV